MTRPIDAKQTIEEIELYKDIVTAWTECALELGRQRKPVKDIGRLVVREAENIQELWKKFTQERDDLSKVTSSKKTVLAYLLGFHPANAARMQLLLRRMDEKCGLFSSLKKSGAPIVWNDFGCGTGALSQVFLSRAKRSKLDLSKIDMHLSDENGISLNTVRELFSRIETDARISTHKGRLEAFNLGDFRQREKDTVSIYALGYVWNEISKNERARSKLLKILGSHLAREKSLVFILEPASQFMSRDAMQLRDDLVSEGYFAIYPCPSQEPCPMLLRKRDWCYSEAVWSRPNSVQKVDEVVGINRHRIGVSAYAFASPKMMEDLTKGKGESSIVVGKPLRGRKRGNNPSLFDFLLCSKGALEKVKATAKTAGLLRGMTFPKKG